MSSLLTLKMGMVVVVVVVVVERGGRDDLGEGEGFYFILFLKLG